MEVEGEEERGEGGEETTRWKVNQNLADLTSLSR